MRTVVPVFVALSIAAGIAAAQDTSALDLREKLEEVKGSVEGINEVLAELKPALDALRKIKVSGYIQAQFQSGEGAGGWNGAATSGPASIGGFAGGSLPKDVASRFSVRRGRLKVAYDNDLTQYVLQIDVTQGGVGIKDAYVMVREPWMRTLSLTAGVFDRPFGFEISHSSSARETPERSRMFQTLFPGERDLGMKLEVNALEGFFSYVNLKAGLFNGTGPTANENDNAKDFIGRAGFTIPFQEINLSVDGGVSMYSGSVRSNSPIVYRKATNRDSSGANIGKYFDRQYLGADLQLFYDLPVSFLGGLSIRAEVIQGTQPATQTTNAFYNPGTTVTPLYEREFLGYYVAYIQNIGLSNQFMLKYDVFEPNANASSANVGAPGSFMNLGDIKFTTFGLGWIHHWDANVKFVAYYEMISNDKVFAGTTSNSLKPYVEDIHDNVFTFRVQYKF